MPTPRDCTFLRVDKATRDRLRVLTSHVMPPFRGKVNMKSLIELFSKKSVKAVREFLINNI